MKVTTDIDIDVASRDEVLRNIPHINAAIVSDGLRRKHNTGVYFQPIDHDIETNISNVDHREAEELGFFKIDLLNLSIYNQVRDEDHLEELLEREPLWELLEEEEFISNLLHVKKYRHLMVRFKPRSIEDLAVILAIIRPGKWHLQNLPWETILEKVWEKGDNEKYSFKRSHAISYAALVVVNMNLLVEQIERR